jgi:hypothetical protein
MLLLGLLLTSAWSLSPEPSIMLAAGNVTERVIFHASQTPGYTAWVGLWSMPGGEIMTNFVEAKGMHPEK